MTSIPHVPVSWGDLIDKISILEIKVERLRQQDAVENAARELALLLDVLAGVDPADEKLAQLRQALGVVNRRIWDVEDEIRKKEALQAFDDGFIALARAVYHTNDERARIKREINLRLGSGIIEEKQYVRY